jgi:hypothetical protein
VFITNAKEISITNETTVFFIFLPPAMVDSLIGGVSIPPLVELED